MSGEQIFRRSPFAHMLWSDIRVVILDMEGGGRNVAKSARRTRRTVAGPAPPPLTVCAARHQRDDGRPGRGRRRRRASGRYRAAATAAEQLRRGRLGSTQWPRAHISTHRHTHELHALPPTHAQLYSVLLFQLTAAPAAALRFCYHLLAICTSIFCDVNGT